MRRSKKKSVSSVTESLPLDEPAQLVGNALFRLKSILLPAPSPHSPVLEDGVGSEELTAAAVLFPIVNRPLEPTVLLTQRTAHLKDHPGQISFPGGRCEDSDRSPIETALREAAEEIGLASRHVQIIGYLPEYRTGTGFRITPVVGLVTPPFDLHLDKFEVAEVFEVPLSFLLDPANHQRHSIHYRGQLRNYHAMPYGNHYIWGATAGIIVSLYQLLTLNKT
ncbi:MAG: CoA pyrophosphatase [Candidatus Accumulibacter sp.]|nr:CoA pyrophosphatase [Accumulibacter sp.]